MLALFLVASRREYCNVLSASQRTKQRRRLVALYHGNRTPRPRGATRSALIYFGLCSAAYASSHGCFRASDELHSLRRAVDGRRLWLVRAAGAVGVPTRRRHCVRELCARPLFKRAVARGRCRVVGVRVRLGVKPPDACDDGDVRHVHSAAVCRSVGDCDRCVRCFERMQLCLVESDLFDIESDFVLLTPLGL